jgi:hypothetical protein
VQDGASLVDLGKAIKDLDRKAATAVRKRVRSGISAAGADVAAAVKADSAWSHRIPGTVRVVTSFSAKSAGVTITAGGVKAPHARPLDSGNRSGGTINRHPVFARKTKTSDTWTWVNQPTRPFFQAAVTAQTPAINRRMQAVLDDVASDLGFH